MSHVLGIDPGFASIGVVLVEPVSMQLHYAHVFRTTSERKARTVLAADDNFRRAKEIASWLRQFNGIDLICAESMSFPRNAATAAKIALCWGVVAMHANVKSIPVVQASPAQIKKRVCGAANANDDRLRAALEGHFPGGITEFIEKTIAPKTQQQHVWDALAAVWACRDSEPFLMLRKRLGAHDATT